MGYSGGGGEFGLGMLFLEPPPHSTHPQNYKKKRKEYEQLAMGDPGADTQGGIIVVGVGSVGREGYFSSLHHT